MPDKTPASALTGVELCERVALALGWKRDPESPDVFYTDDNHNHFRIVPDDEDFRKRFQVSGCHRWDGFRPDLDGNHLAEVKAFLHGTMLLGWMVGVAPRGEYAHAVIWLPEFDDNGDQEAVREEGDTEALAFLRAFVAASEAEKEKIQ